MKFHCTICGKDHEEIAVYGYPSKHGGVLTFYFPELKYLMQHGVDDCGSEIIHYWDLETFIIDAKFIYTDEEYLKILEAIALSRDRIRGIGDWQIPLTPEQTMIWIASGREATHFTNCPFVDNIDYERDCAGADCKECIKTKNFRTIKPRAEDKENIKYFDELAVAQAFIASKHFHLTSDRQFFVEMTKKETQ